MNGLTGTGDAYKKKGFIYNFYFFIFLFFIFFIFFYFFYLLVGLIIDAASRLTFCIIKQCSSKLVSSVLKVVINL